jgi:hypothetical protein
MATCDSFRDCTFLRSCESLREYKLAVAGFIRLYCSGPKIDECVRKKVGRELGGQQHVPANMLPNGLPRSGTSDADWPEEVKKISRRRL